MHAGHLNELAVTGAASPVAVNTGAALVDGIPYENTASVNQAIATPSVGTTGHRIVLRASWAAQTVRITDIASADGVAAIPAAVQIAGTTYDITLATLTITTGGVITLTDARSYLHYTTKVSTAMLDDLGVTGAKVAAATITGANIAAETIIPANLLNRQRQVFVPVIGGFNHTDGTAIVPSNIVDGGGAFGLALPDNKLCSAQGQVYTPVDFVSGAQVYAVFEPLATGNLYAQLNVQYSAFAEAFALNTNSVGYSALGVTTGLRASSFVVDLTTIALGDYISIRFERDAVSVTDTVSATVNLLGFIFTYLADS